MHCSLLVWRVALLLSLGVTLAAAGTVSAAPAAPVRIDLASPEPGETVRNKVHLAPVRGNAHSGASGPVNFDVIIAIDVSKSTRFPSGIDVDEDGEIGFNPELELVAPGEYPEGTASSDPDDSVLAASAKAAHLLLSVLDPGHTQVGIIAFSGDVNMKTGRRKSRDQQDAWVVQPLSDNFGAVGRAVDELLAEGPHGATNFSAAIQRSVVELAGLTGAKSKGRSEAKKVVLFLTDGVPTFPFGRGSRADPEDTEAAINAARLARKAGIAINTYALGRHALSSPVAVTEMARLTGGSYTPVRNPGDIVAFLQGISFANVEDVVITNLTTSEVSYDVSLAPDGSFSGFVPVRDGKNTLQITALASDGGEGSLEFDLDFEKSGLSERELARELERIRARNKELMLLLERKRIEAFRERQRKRVTIEAEQ